MNILCDGEEEWIEKKKANILIICGAIAFAVFYIVAKIIFRIPTVNNLAAVLGLSTWIPIVIGVMMHGIRLEKEGNRWGHHIIFFSIVSLLAYIVSSIATLIKII